MTSMEWMTATDARRRLDSGDMSAGEYCKAVLQHIHKANSSVNAIVALRDEAAIAEAEAADSIPVAKRGLLHGIPFTVKDTSGTGDMVTTMGSLALADHRPDADDASVAWARRAGAILIGKTNTPEFAMRPPSTTNRIFGQTRNPWNLAYSPGGSSGGTAAAVAMGFGPIAEGSDGGGSMRVPAACCGVVGMKPSRGRISSAPSFDSVAGLSSKALCARTVEDVALMLEAVSNGVHGDFYHCPPAEPGQFLHASRTKLPKSRIAYTMKPRMGELDSQVEAAFGRALDVLAGMGHELVPVELPLAALAQRHQLIFHVWCSSHVAQHVAHQDHDKLDRWTARIMAKGQKVSAFEYCTALDELRKISSDMMNDLKSFRFVVTPTMARLPPPIDGWPSSWDDSTLAFEVSQMLSFTSAFNDTGMPALSLPCGFSEEGLPIGLQIAGHFADDAGTLALGAAFGRITAQPLRFPKGTVS
jgi:amidase